MKSAFFLGLLPAFLVCNTTFAYDRFSEAHAPKRFAISGSDETELVLKGRLSLQWRDLEGPGGPRHDSHTDTATLGTRSAHFALDSARLAVRIEMPGGLAVYTAYAFTDLGAALESGWLDHRWSQHRWSVHSELGLNQPFVGVDPETARLPLADRIYWGRSEAHATTEITYRGRSISTQLGLSVAMMRPLGADAVNDAAHRRGTIAVLTYDQARPFSGNGPVFGAKAGLDWGPASAVGFGYMGLMAAEGGIDELRNRLAGFDLLPGYDPQDPHRQSEAFWWAGGRIQFNPKGVRLRVTGVWSQESLLRRNLLAAQAGYVWHLAGGPTFRSIEARVRGERYRLQTGAVASNSRAFRNPDPSQALSWDFDVLTMALATRLYGTLLRLRAEHSIIAEHNGSPRLGRSNKPIRNNETTIGVGLRF